MVASPPASMDALADDLERLDAAAVTAGVEALAESGTPLDELLDATLLPAWDRVDARCRAGEADAAVAGAAAALARRAIVGSSRLAARASVGAQGPLHVVSPPGPADLLRSEAAAEAAASVGWLVQQVNGADPAGELAAYIRTRRPEAIVVAAHDPADLLCLLPVIGVAHDQGIPVLAWGPAFGATGQRGRRIGADGWARNLQEMLVTLTAWRDRVPELVAPLPLPAAHAELERLRPALVQAGLGAGEAAWARRAAPALVDQLVAAVVFEEPGLLGTHLERERRGPADDARVVALVDAVASALPSTAGAARDYAVHARDELRRQLLGAPRPLHGGDGVGGLGGVGGAHAGQVFADLLLLAALSCQTQLALLSVPQAGGQWRTLSYGFEERTGLDDRRLFDLIASRREALEIPDLAVHPDLVRSPLALPPHNLRWAYGVALRHTDGPVLGVVLVLDRWLRQVSRREQRALSAVARQAADRLAQLRRGPAAAGGPAAGSGAPLGAPALPAAPQHDPLSGLVSLRRAGSMPDGQQLLRSHEVAVLFDVTERTVINWAASGKLPSLRTIGGHLRFRREDVLELLDGRSNGLRARRSS